jgi:ribose/xylose/arabinose/galactoside ABC-type transport system permease subunit
MKPIWRAREFSTILILALEILFFAWYLWPPDGSAHPFLNLDNFLLVLKYSSIYGIAAVGAAIIIVAGLIDLAPGAIIGLTSVVTGYFFVNAGWPLSAAMLAGLLVGVVAGSISAWLVVKIGLPPFIATLGIMGIWRGIGFIITEARFYDLSSKLPADWHIAGLSVDWAGPVIMIVLAVSFHFIMRRFQWGRAVFAVGGNETAALFSGIRVGRVKTVAYIIAGLLASVSGVVLAVVQGQGKADLATGYELDIIASAVVGGASLSGGRGSVLGAVLGALIFGVLRNALPQIPGATFYDRMIVGVVVIVIVVMDQVLVKRSRA